MTFFRLQTIIVVLSFCSLASAGYLNGGGVPYTLHHATAQEVYDAPIHHQQYESIQHIEPAHQHYEQFPIHHQQYESIQHIEPAHQHYEQEFPIVHSAPAPHHQHYETVQHFEPVHQHYEHVPIVHEAPVHEHVEAIQHIEPDHHHHVETHVQHIPVVHSAPQVIKIYQDVPHHHHNEVTRILRIRYNNDEKQSFSPLSLLQRFFSS